MLNKNDPELLMCINRKIDRIIDLKKRRLLRVRQIKKRLQEKALASINAGRSSEFLDRRIFGLIEREVELESLLQKLLIQDEIRTND